MNFLPRQYVIDSELAVRHSYLSEQFAEIEPILEKIRRLTQDGDFTLGKEVDVFEANFARLQESSFCIAVGSGTDAIKLSLKSVGVEHGSEVITTPFTFYATVGPIVELGAKPTFVDVGEDGNIDSSQIEAAINENTRAILPVHWGGRPCDMDKITAIGRRFQLPVVEDACHSVLARYKGKRTGTLGKAGAFSMHPLKNLNVWGDGGMITTNDENLASFLKKYRNHGLSSRNTCEFFGVNSRLDTLQAIVANFMLEKIEFITQVRRRNSKLLDELLRDIDEIQVVVRNTELEEVFHLYWFKALKRDDLLNHLRRNGIDAKVHYPIPLHLQPAAKFLEIPMKSYSVAERLALSTISLPVHEFISEKQIRFMASKIEEFYAN